MHELLIICLWITDCPSMTLVVNSGHKHELKQSVHFQRFFEFQRNFNFQDFPRIFIMFILIFIYAIKCGMSLGLRILLSNSILYILPNYFTAFILMFLIPIILLHVC